MPLFAILDALGQLRLELRRQLRRGRASGRLVGIEGDPAAGARVDAGPVGRRGRRQTAAAVCLLLERDGRAIRRFCAAFRGRSSAARSLAASSARSVFTSTAVPISSAAVATMDESFMTPKDTPAGLTARVD